MPSTLQELNHILQNISCELNATSESKKLNLLFDLLKNEKELISMNGFIKLIFHTGLRKSDPRLRLFFKNVAGFRQRASEISTDSSSGGCQLTREEFMDCIQDNCELIRQALQGEFIIPDFYRFTEMIEKLYYKCKDNTEGHVADYIPQLARYSPNYWAVTICTVDGQRFSIGDSKIPFCVQSACKPLNYAIALNDLTAEEVHQHVGQEPSGRSFNELSLDRDKKPHNPMINAGAIATVSLLKTKWAIADRFEYVYREYRRLAGGEFIGFSNSTFLSERETADRNFALAYYMQEYNVFPKEAKLLETVELYFQLCSVEINAESGCIIAATLANGGICPLTGERVLSSEAVRNTLSLMHSCGMYDYSGQYAFKVGLPAKSGVSGVVMLVVPNVMGICTWSPPLDEMGNSVRGIHFCEDLVRIFNFHNYDNLRHTQQKYDPIRREIQSQSDQVVALLFSAAKGDIRALRRFYLQGMDLSQCDYDGRTALHLAAAEGHLNVVQFLLEKCKVDCSPRDRWNFCPADDAMKFGHGDLAEYLKKFSSSATPLPHIATP